VTWIAAALTGFALSACAGLRVFLPLFAAGLAARLAEWPLAAGAEWLASDAALVSFGVATAVEIAADKVPALDHLLDGAQTFLAPAAGALLAASSFGDLPPWAALALGVATGAPIAGGVHLLAATTRLQSSLFTAGAGNPVLSLAEDVLAAVGAVVAFVWPVLVVATGIGAAFWIRRRRRRRAARARAASPAPAPGRGG